MRLYIRHKPSWINFVTTVDELKDFCEVYESGYSRSSKVSVLGDVSLFTTPMLNILLKFIEENPQVDLYSSQDLQNSILLSRIPEVIKDPLPRIYGELNLNDFQDSSKDYQSVQNYLNVLSNQYKLRATHLSRRQLNLITSL